MVLGGLLPTRPFPGEVGYEGKRPEKRKGLAQALTSEDQQVPGEL